MVDVQVTPTDREPDGYQYGLREYLDCSLVILTIKLNNIIFLNILLLRYVLMYLLMFGYLLCH